jgi:ribonuclease Z
MRPLFLPQLVNGPCGDPLVYVDFLFGRRAFLLDLGDVHELAPRKLLRVSHVFISHTHMDHFIGFDALLRVCVGREKRLTLLGPEGLLRQVENRLGGYTWNLVENYAADFVLEVTELGADGRARAAVFRCRTRFRREQDREWQIGAGRLLDEPTLVVNTATLDHRIPSLAFAVEEKQHINVWKNKLDELGLPTGPWLQDAKRALAIGAGDDVAFTVRWLEQGRACERCVRLGELRKSAVRIERGQKIAYVTDAVYHDENAERIVELCRGADILFIEAVFLREDADRAAATCHLTAEQAGRLARLAGAARAVPLHFSARYSDGGLALQREFMAAFAGQQP